MVKLSYGKEIEIFEKIFPIFNCKRNISENASYLYLDPISKMEIQLQSNAHLSYNINRWIICQNCIEIVKLGFMHTQNLLIDSIKTILVND